jgi:hypothetical protein
MERAINALEGVVWGLLTIEFEALDTTRVSEWADALRSARSRIGQVLRRMTT